MDIFVQEDFVNKKISMRHVLDSVFKKVPTHLSRGLDAIYVGNFDFLNNRDLDAMYKDGAIFLSNDKKSVADVADDIVHELAHLVETEYGSLIYGDGQIEQEFIEKRKDLFFSLKEEMNNMELTLIDFLDPEYNPQFDQFLYQELGYSMLSIMTINLFYSPYGATSLREYFANCFEGFFWDRDIVRIKSLSPKVYSKLERLIEEVRENENEY